MTSSPQISVLIADDHAIVRQGLRALLLTVGDFRIVGEAGNGREAVEMAEALRPAVILLDIAMPLLNGLEATRQIIAANPAARIILLSAHRDGPFLEGVWEAGAAGFVEKHSSAGILFHAIREAAGGRTFFSADVARRMSGESEWSKSPQNSAEWKTRRLSPRQAEVLQLVAEGALNKQIAAALRISIKTVEKHRQQLMDKLNIHDTAGLTRHAIAVGVIESCAQPDQELAGTLATRPASSRAPGPATAPSRVS